MKWSIPGRYGEFLIACARNIMQAREIRNGRLTYQVGPTVYRGLWIVVTGPKLLAGNEAVKN